MPYVAPAHTYSQPQQYQQVTNPTITTNTTQPPNTSLSRACAYTHAHNGNTASPLIVPRTFTVIVSSSRRL
eukprot:m.108867 g.108867  ORF g.108867 m.108867 type:complete len:71 (+) comp27910_c3_seq1:205-417(+)